MVDSIAGTSVSREALDAAIGRASAHLLSLQHADGYWRGELEANATMASEHLMLEAVLGIGEPERWRKIGRYLLDRQLADGSWPIYDGGPGDLSITVEAYAALKLAGLDADAPALALARQFVRDHGGAGRARVFTRLWLALFGEFDWDGLPALPPEAILLSPRSPLSIYAFASWARATIVPILVVWAQRPAAETSLSVAELFLAPADRRRIDYRRDAGLLGWRNLFLALDRLLRLHERSAWKPLRRRSLAACEAWIVRHQEADGSWAGIQPPWVYSLIALKSLGYPNDHAVMARGIRGLLDGFGLETEETFTIQPCVSPVWDTALAVTGLREAGLAADQPALLKAGRWLLDREVRSRGDWSVTMPAVEPGGWPFEFANEMYPDTDDSAEVLIALRLLDLAAEATAPKSRARRWLAAMQSRNGGWGAFDRDNDREFVAQIPFCDFGAALDPPTEDVTAHIVEMLALSGAAGDAAFDRALAYLWRHQAADGSWFGRWGVNYVYGTGAVVPALVAAGARPDDPRLRRAVAWLAAQQNRDGGWGESCASYEDVALHGRGDSTASQTAWALLALLAVDGPGAEPVQRGLAYLVGTQLAGGGWDEPQFTGTGFPRDFMLNYHLYRDYWPLWALGRYRRLLDERPLHLPGGDPLA